MLEIKQIRLGECAPRVASKGVAFNLLCRDIRRDERWLEFKVRMGGRQRVGAAP